jgi:hypothetical protein
MDGFSITNIRTVTKQGEEPRVLRLNSIYRPSRNVTLVGTGGKPAGPSQVVPNRAAPSSSASTGATPKPAAQPAPKPAAAAPTAAPVAAPKPAAPAAAPKPVVSPLFPSASAGSVVPKPGH